MQRRTILVMLTTLIIISSFSLGIFAGTRIGQKAGLSNPNDTYQAGWNAAKARLSQSPMGMAIPGDMEIKNVSGSIQEINGNKLVVKINPLELLADPALDIRTIVVDENTKINLAIQKDQVKFQKEMEVFQEKMAQAQVQATSTDPLVPADPMDMTNPILPPMPFESKSISSSELKAGQQISVIAIENIKDKKEFTASQIDAQEIPVAMPPMPDLSATR